MADLPDLWPHQAEAIQRSKNLEEYAFLFDPGCGKSRTFIESLRIKVLRAGRLMKVLILCPAIVVRNWRDEFLKYSRVDPKNIVLLEGSEKERLKKLSINCFSYEDPHKIVVTNYEGLLMDGLREQLKKWAPEVLCADEMHLLKDPSTKRSKYTRELGEIAMFRYGLTGTAVLNSLMDVYGQWLFLDKGKAFGKNFFVFRNTYFYDKNAGMPAHVHFPKWVPFADSANRIKEKMQAIATTAEKDKVLSLPPLVKQVIHVQMTPEQAKHYKSLKQEFLTWLKNQEGQPQAVVANNALTRSMRLMQLTSGFLTSEEGEEIEFKKNPKMQALDELLDMILPNKVVIWASFIRNYEMIRKVVAKHKVNMVECHGEISNAKKFANVEQFNTDPETKVFLGHPRSLGIGINLVSSKYMIYFSRGYSLGDDIQSEAREHRAGCEVHESVTRYDIVMDETIDEECQKALADKKEVSFSVLKNWLVKEVP